MFSFSNRVASSIFRTLFVFFVIVVLAINVSTDVLADTKLLIEITDEGAEPILESVREIKKIEKRKADNGDMSKWHIVTVDEERKDEAVEELLNEADAVRIEEEQMYSAFLIPSDPGFSKQYGLLNTENEQSDVSIENVWNTVPGASDITVAIIDNGVDVAHEDIRDRVWVNRGEVPGNGVDDDNNGFVDDVYGWDFVTDSPANFADDHATHVAGIVGASSNNGIGVAGVDWRARIMSVRVLNGSSGYTSDVVSGIVYAVDNGADVINLSLGGPPSAAMLDAVEYAYTNGVVVVAAAGNATTDTGSSPLYPACAEPDGINMVLGVAALNEVGSQASFSNYGSCADVVAPGVSIFSLLRGGQYGYMTGTSMSAPFVSGVSSLYLSQHKGADPSAVIAAITVGDVLVDGSGRSYGVRLNAANVLGISDEDSEEGLPEPGASPVPTPSPSPAPISTPPSRSEGDSGGSSGGGGGGGGGDCCGGGEQADPPVRALVAKGRVRGVSRASYNAALLPKINSAFRSVFSRNPKVVEHRYWYGRVKSGDKETYEALVGAMKYQRALGRTFDPATPLRHGTLHSVTATKNTSLVHEINSLHREAYERNPSMSEHAYWMHRVVSGEKITRAALLGAMKYHALLGIRH